MPENLFVIITAVAIAYSLLTAILGTQQILASAFLQPEDKLMRITTLWLVPPIGLLVHFQWPPVLAGLDYPVRPRARNLQPSALRRSHFATVIGYTSQETHA